jgi:hypothetical protein
MLAGHRHMEAYGHGTQWIEQAALPEMIELGLGIESLTLTFTTVVTWYWQGVRRTLLGHTMASVHRRPPLCQVFAGWHLMKWSCLRIHGVLTLG